MTPACRGCAGLRADLRVVAGRATRDNDAGLPLTKHVADIARLKARIAACSLCGVTR